MTRKWGEGRGNRRVRWRVGEGVPGKRGGGWEWGTLEKEVEGGRGGAEDEVEVRVGGGGHREGEEGGRGKGGDTHGPPTHSGDASRDTKYRMGRRVGFLSSMVLSTVAPRAPRNSIWVLGTSWGSCWYRNSTASMQSRCTLAPSSTEADVELTSTPPVSNRPGTESPAAPAAPPPLALAAAELAARRLEPAGPTPAPAPAPAPAPTAGPALAASSSPTPSLGNRPAPTRRSAVKGKSISSRVNAAITACARVGEGKGRNSSPMVSYKTCPIQNYGGAASNPTTSSHSRPPHTPHPTPHTPHPTPHTPHIHPTHPHATRGPRALQRLPR
jgi:hypothetical protein